MNLRALLLAFAILFAQQGALLHALEHAAHEANVAALDHEIEKCVAYDAVGHGAQGSSLFVFASHVPAGPSFLPAASITVTARIVFDSRAPPFSA